MHLLGVFLVFGLLLPLQSICPPNTFTCRDGSCIPEDWVGDGEVDCDDRSDETGSASNKTKEDDPFDDIVTQSPHLVHSSKELEHTSISRHLKGSPLTTSSSSPTEDCPYEHQLRIDECSEPVLLFLHEVNAIYFENSSLLADKEMQAKIEKGCDLMHEYSICIQGASQSCNPDEGVQAWREVEMYACQLLIPAVREHEQCFGKGRDHRCKMIFDPLASPFCRLVTSVSQDVQCVEKFSSGCSEAAIEILQPILEESQQISATIRCRSIKEASEESFKEDSEEAVSNKTALTVDKSIEKIPSHDEVEAITASSSTEMTRTMEQNFGSSVTTDGRDENNSVTHELRINMSDAVNSMYYIYDICSSNYTHSVFAAIAMKMCERQDEIAKHSDCFQTTLEKEKCAMREAKTPCEAFEAFNANLDCAIVTMNDVCEIDAQNLIVEIQEVVNDIIIEKKCFNEETKTKGNVSEKKVEDGEFTLYSKLPKCEDEQENGALACLVELLEINKQLTQFQNLNFLLEIATDNSTVVSNICGLYGKYEQCLQTSVFRKGKRCSFASPLNTLARIGLAPICSLDSRPLLASHRECLQQLAQQSAPDTNCQSGLGVLGNTVNMMLQGIHGEALLCKSFYLIRDTFSCGERAVKKYCDAKALEDLGLLKGQMSALGEEEGCPKDPPADLDAIIARPVKKPQIDRPSQPIAAPMARPLASSTTPPVVRTPITQAPMCIPQHQKHFEECVRPLTAFQPHPLSVIKLPRQIDEACAEFTKYEKCVSGVDCHPLWAKGMTAMFSYACGEGADGYKKIRHCLRKISSEDTVRNCVSNFSRGAPTQACFSANTLLSCAIGSIQNECGQEASEWVNRYVNTFATAIDPRCKLASQLPIGRVVGVGCTPEEETIIDHCAAPLNDIGSRLEELFQGGLQSMIKNINSLAPVFAGGCNLTDEFRACASFILSGHSPCVVSSCLIQAGANICDQPDPAKAIDDNLSCVFSQVQEPSFAKCIRSTLATVKQFTLNSFRMVLPKFIDCTQEIVLTKCGETPLKVLRAMSSPDICPVGSTPIIPIKNHVNQPVKVEPVLPTCTAEKRTLFDQCTRPFYSRYRMLPITLINELDKLDQICTDVSIMDSCSLKTRICSSSEQTALKRMIEQICATKQAFDQHKICLKTVATSPNGTSCMSEFISASPADRCAALQGTAECMAKQVRDECGQDALSYAYSSMGEYAKMMDKDCHVNVPSVSLTTGCSEPDMVQYLSCESTIDSFSFRPISIIGDDSKWDEFCSMFSSSYKPCIEKMKCRFEPVSSANTQLFDIICNRPVTYRDQKSFGECLSHYTNTPEGQKCIGRIAEVDPVAQPQKMCNALNAVLSCASADIEKKCGYDAVLHVYDLHIQWAQSYNKTCQIDSPEPKSIPSNTLDESKDAEPQHFTKDETTPGLALQTDYVPSTVTVSKSAPETTPKSISEPQTTLHPKDISIKSSTTSVLSVLLVFVVVSFGLF